MWGNITQLVTVSRHNSILCLYSPPSAFTCMPDCPLAHISLYFLIVFFLSANLIFIHFWAKLSSYFYLQCQQLHYQSVKNCIQIRAVTLKSSPWVTAGPQLLVSVLRMEEAESRAGLSVLIRECPNHSVTSKYHHLNLLEVNGTSWIWSCSRLCSWCHWTVWPDCQPLLKKDPELVFRGGGNGISSEFWYMDKDLWIYRSGIMG